MPASHETGKAVCGKKGVLLINLGSPASTAVRDVRTWLREFLMDGYVIDLPWLIRALLVTLISTVRTTKTAMAYRSIWTAQGSPLLTHTKNLAALVNRHLQADQSACVDYAMRYGKPDIETAMLEMAEAGVDRLLIAPLYPQYAMSTTETSWQKSLAVKRKHHLPVQLFLLPPFYKAPAYIQLLSEGIAGKLQNLDALLFSYHGLPEQHLLRTDPTGNHCLRTTQCCQLVSSAHATCYLHQAKTTSARVAEQLALPDSFWHISFQSRLGTAVWLKPYTDQVLAALPGQGIRHLGVVCPAFVSDNLETLEEIQLRGRETFLAAGGKTFSYISCLNELDAWGPALARLCLDAFNEPMHRSD